MIIKIVLFSLALVGLALLGIGFKLIVDKKARLPVVNCGASLNETDGMSCGCGAGGCELKTEELSAPSKPPAGGADRMN